MKSAPASVRFAASLLGIAAALLAAGCQPTVERFADLQPSYFSSLNVFDAAAVESLPAFEGRMERMAAELSGRLDRGEITDPGELSEAGRALFYAGFLPLGVNQAIYDGFAEGGPILARADAELGSDREKLAARIRRAQALLGRGGLLRPDWAPAAAIQVGARYDLEEAQGSISAATLDAVVAAAQPDIFGTFSAVILTRNPELHPLDAPYMERLYTLLCSPQRFSCDHIGPPPPPDPSAERTMTALVAGPVILSDFLVRRAELLTARADGNPAQAMASLGEAMGRLQMAAGALLNAQLNARADDLSSYPASDTFDRRQERLDLIKDAVAARLAASPAPPLLPEARSYYRSRTYRAAYQCAACHMPRPGLQGIPK